MDTLKINNLTQEDISKLEKLNADFRDALITFREHRYHNSGMVDQDKVKQTQSTMNHCIKEAKALLSQYKIRDIDTLKKVSNKFFMIEFLNGVFDTEIYSIDDEIDCGL